MEEIRVSAKTLDEAITNACIELGVTSDNLDYTIITHGTNGFLGIGAKPYVISARSISKKPEITIDDIKKEIVSEYRDMAEPAANTKNAAPNKSSASNKPAFTSSSDKKSGQPASPDKKYAQTKAAPSKDNAASDNAKNAKNDKISDKTDKQTQPKEGTFDNVRSAEDQHSDKKDERKPHQRPQRKNSDQKGDEKKRADSRNRDRDTRDRDNNDKVPSDKELSDRDTREKETRERYTHDKDQRGRRRNSSDREIRENPKDDNKNINNPDSNDSITASAETSVKDNKHEKAEREIKPLVLTEDPIKRASDFLDSLFKSMEISCEHSMEYNNEKNELTINLSGEDMGVLIGKRGQTLDSLQYLVSQVVNKRQNGYILVKLDTENYRERRKETLETFALNMAKKVKKNNRPVVLEPMNAYERRIIHSALQSEPGITTRSEGEEPYRHVVICPVRKKGGR